MKKTLNLLGGLLIILLAIIQLGCTKEKEEQFPNIVWITSEDNSKHYMELFDTNGVKTPNIEALANSGVIFTSAFSNTPVCSAARSTLISGCYGPRIASHYHRALKKVPMPDTLEMFPAYLRKAGYYTTNNSKEDYNIIKSDAVWDESSNNASWRNRAKEQPFFHVFNIGTPHESGLHFSKEQMNSTNNMAGKEPFSVQPNHPQTEIFRYTNSLYRDKIVKMDEQVGEIMTELEKDDLLENTFIFYFSDHGGVLPGSKGYIYETGLHIPLVVHIPKKYQHLVDAKIGSEVKGFISFIDFAPTVLNLAGVEIPKEIDGKPFLGRNISTKEVNERDETYSYADRFDEKYDMVRAVRKGRYKYIRNYQPFNFDGLRNNYRYKQLAYQEWLTLYKMGELNEIQSQFFESKESELLFNLESDPYETKNIANDPVYSAVLKEMRLKLNNWVEQMPDLSFYPEHFLVKNAFENPIRFGQQHKTNIQNYADIANLSLLDIEKAKYQLKASLKSKDAWSRYWGLTVCSSFGEKAVDFEPIVKQMAQKDPELINRVRAAEFLGLIKSENPSIVMANALYETQDEVEALLILNSIVLMKDGGFDYIFDIKVENISANVKNDSEVKRRLKYLNLI